ncbi:MAG: hypothetical protein Q9227_006600 [Pyrenula ochraceoflavens]
MSKLSQCISRTVHLCFKALPRCHGYPGAHFPFRAFDLITLLPGGGAGAHTYRVDTSFRNHGLGFRTALHEAITWPGRASRRLVSSNELQIDYFERVFSPSGRSGDSGYEEEVRRVATMYNRHHVLGHPKFEPGISGIIPEPAGNQDLANYRYYYDDDCQDPEGNCRWKLRPDPPEKDRPVGYVLQAIREYQDQEWNDNQNGILLGRENCKSGFYAAVTKLKKLAGDYKQPLRATITLCDAQLQRNSFATSLTSLLRFDLSRWNDFYPDGTPLPAIDLFKQTSATTLIHECCHLPPWLLENEDASFPSPITGATAFGWKNVQALSPGKEMNNVDNYVYFSILAVLADNGWRLARNEEAASFGRLERFR